jgi:hypothetical protein
LLIRYGCTLFQAHIVSKNIAWGCLAKAIHAQAAAIHFPQGRMGLTCELEVAHILLEQPLSSRLACSLDNDT